MNHLKFMQAFKQFPRFCSVKYRSTSGKFDAVGTVINHHTNSMGELVLAVEVPGEWNPATMTAGNYIKHLHHSNCERL